MINIAIIITCFNRKEKTTRCLESLFASETRYNATHGNSTISLSIFLTDDASSDGTAEAVKSVCYGHELRIIQGNGHCYWAGGMRMAWSEALKEPEKWDFYGLVNDDTYAYYDAFDTLLSTHEFAMQHYGSGGIYSGITCDTTDKKRITYGGYVWTNYLLGKDRLLKPTGTPQMADKANCNLTLVHNSVVEAIGIFWHGYQHGAADYDYSMTARKRGIPVLVTAKVAGECEYDHNSEEGTKLKLLSMTLGERKAYFNNPLHSSLDVLRLKRRCTPIRYPLGWLGRTLNLYSPKLYYFLSNLRLK